MTVGDMMLELSSVPSDRGIFLRNGNIYRHLKFSDDKYRITPNGKEIVVIEYDSSDKRELQGIIDSLIPT